MCETLRDERDIVDDNDRISTDDVSIAHERGVVDKELLCRASCLDQGKSWGCSRKHRDLLSGMRRACLPSFKRQWSFRAFGKQYSLVLKDAMDSSRRCFNDITRLAPQLE